MALTAPLPAASPAAAAAAACSRKQISHIQKGHSIVSLAGSMLARSGQVHGVQPRCSSVSGWPASPRCLSCSCSPSFSTLARSAAAAAGQRTHRGIGIRASSVAANKVPVQDHETFLRDVAAVEPPSLLPALLRVLQAQGHQLASPSQRRGIIPLAVPLARDPESGDLIALLRWPTPPEGLEMPVVRILESSGLLLLLAKSISEYIHRALVEEDAAGEGSRKLADAAGEEGGAIYSQGSFAASGIPRVDVYLMKKVGKFPDVFERLALSHLEGGDEVSALVTGEFFTRPDHFPGFGRPFAFNAELLKRVGRDSEARDAASIAMRSPWWTLGLPYRTIMNISGYGEAQLEYAKERLSEQGKADDLKKGKAPAQVALDQAAFLLDVAYAEASWDSIREDLAKLYQEGGIDDMASFVLEC